MIPPLIFDAHLDLSMNALEWNRDLTQPLGEIRQRESALHDKPDRGRGVVCFPEMRRGGIGICVATQIARIEHNAYSPVFGWASPAQAWAQTQGQLAWYRAMEEAGEMRQIRDAAELTQHLQLWAEAQSSESPGKGEAAKIGNGINPNERPLPIGYILSLEGADSILSIAHLEASYTQGLRALGPAHYGPGVYANGTDATGGFNAKGRELLKAMDRLGLILDASHLCDECFWEAMDLYSGPIWASHSNCRALTPHPRQFTDDQIRALAQRGAVIGAALDAWMLVPKWERGVTTPEAMNLRLATYADHIDHICQVAGNARHAGIGSDLDGAFGREQIPLDIESIADLQKLPPLLNTRGYSQDDVRAILSGNFLAFLKRALPK